MGEIGKIKKTVAFADLPEDIRNRFAPGKPVTVVYEGEVANASPSLTPEEIEARKDSLLRFWGIAAHKNTSIEESVARIRELRDEWD